MVRIGSGGSGEFSIGSGDNQSLDTLSKNSSTVGKFVTSHAQGEGSSPSLGGRVSTDFEGRDYLQAMKERRGAED